MPPCVTMQVRLRMCIVSRQLVQARCFGACKKVRVAADNCPDGRWPRQGWVQGGAALRAKLDEIDGRCYQLLRWLLCSMRGHLRFVNGSNSHC